MKPQDYQIYFLALLVLLTSVQLAIIGVALNAAAVLLVGGLAQDWKEALATSQELLGSGVVWNWLESLRSASI